MMINILQYICELHEHMYTVNYTQCQFYHKAGEKKQIEEVNVGIVTMRRLPTQEQHLLNKAFSKLPREQLHQFLFFKVLPPSCYIDWKEWYDFVDIVSGILFYFILFFI